MEDVLNKLMTILNHQCNVTVVCYGFILNALVSTQNKSIKFGLYMLYEIKVLTSVQQNYIIIVSSFLLFDLLAILSMLNRQYLCVDRDSSCSS